MNDDIDLLREAYIAAMQMSTDPRTQNGAVLVTKQGYTLKDANHFPTGVQENLDRWQKPLKAAFVEHAERNVIYQAAKRGVVTEGATLYCPWFSCTDCARAIIQAGIYRVIGHDTPIHKNRKDWYESCRLGDIMLNESGVQIVRIPHKFEGISILFDGQVVEP